MKVKMSEPLEMVLSRVRTERFIVVLLLFYHLSISLEQPHDKPCFGHNMICKSKKKTDMLCCPAKIN